DLTGIFIFITRHDVAAHDLPRRRGAWICPFGNGTDGDVAIGQHSHDATVFGDGQQTDVHLAHELCGRLHARVARDDPDIARHHFLGQHGDLLFCGTWNRASTYHRRETIKASRLDGVNPLND